MKRLSSGLAVLLCSTACIGGNTDTGQAPPEPEAFSDCSTDDGWPIDLGGFDTQSPPVSISGDTLTVVVGHGGGCTEHLYEICWPDQSFMESEPVQVALEVWHGGERDNCEAYLTETLAFDLSPLKTSWKSAYGEGPGTILVNVMGESAEYSFE